MNKYKCLNPICNHVWSSDEEPFECPNCHSTDFEKISVTGIYSFVKRWWWIGTILIILIFVMSLCSGGSDTTISAKPDYTLCRLSVEIKGKYNDDYRIVLRKDGIIFGDKSKKDKALFTDLEGTYYLDVQFIGNGKLPRINNYKHSYSFSKPLKAPVSPQITKVEQRPLRLTKQNRVYAVTIITETQNVPLSETEFSIDGVTWQKSNVFNNIASGTYSFYVRNTRAKSLIDEKQITLDPFVPAPPPSLIELNSLLQAISSGDQNAMDEFKRILGNKMRVVGANLIIDVQSLANEAFINGTNFSVVKIDTDSDGEITSITVR